MKPILAALAGVLVVPALATAPAAASTTTVPVKLSIDNCTNCQVTASWSKKGGLNVRSTSKLLKADSDTVTFKVPRGDWLYFTATSPNAAVDAASVLVTQYVGQSQGSKVSVKQVRKGTKGAYFCTVAKKGTIKATAGIVKSQGTRLLALWASPQLAAQGKKLPGKDSIKGVYGTQNTLPCT